MYEVYQIDKKGMPIKQLGVFDVYYWALKSSMMYEQIGIRNKIGITYITQSGGLAWIEFYPN